MSRGIRDLRDRVSEALQRRRRRRTRHGDARQTPPRRGHVLPIEVRYLPDDDEAPDPGEVVWAWIPYEEDPEQGKDRPVVVIGTAGRFLAVVTLTSKPHPERDDQVKVGRGAWDREGRVSYARLDRVLGLRPSQVRREGSTLDRRRFEALIDALARQAGWPRVPVEVVPIEQ